MCVDCERAIDQAKSEGHTPCYDCLEAKHGVDVGTCPSSPRECGHHCGHGASQDECCYCGLLFGDPTESPEYVTPRNPHCSH